MGFGFCFVFLVIDSEGICMAVFYEFCFKVKVCILSDFLLMHNLKNAFSLWVKACMVMCYFLVSVFNKTNTNPNDKG